MMEHERLMYRIIGAISELDAPIVFKGALITKLILEENGYTTVQRPTVDIDANWISTPPTMDDLISIVNHSLKSFSGKLYAEAMREYGVKKSAGIAIIEAATGNRIVSMDISVKPVVGSKIYYYGAFGIKGVLVNEILADKITVLSKQIMFRRSKDLIDIYALTHSVKVYTTEIFDVFQSNLDREVGTFDEFIHRREDVEHAYERLRGIENKPSFDLIYEYLMRFIQPFANRDMTPCVWNSQNSSWDVWPEPSQ